MSDAARTLQTSDPAVLRALAHPLRVEILELLDDDGELTASDVAARTGHTVANCSFHLRQLEKAGYVERATPRGRQKPWRAAHAQRRMQADVQDPASVAGVAAVAALVVQREAARLVDHFAHPEDYDPDWVSATTLTTARFWATRDELAELCRAVEALTERFAGRSDDPALRPPGARPARLFAAAHPEHG